MFGRDPRSVLDPRSVALEDYIKDYDTPEAALFELDRHAPQARDAMIEGYRARKGNPFANPFEDFARSRLDAATQVALQGGMTATGSNTGTLIKMPPAIQAATNSAVAAAAGAPGRRPMAGPTLIPAEEEGAAFNPLSPMGIVPNRREVLADAERAANVNRNARYNLDSKEYQIPDSKDKYFLKVLEQRAAAVGNAELFRKITRNNPQLLDNYQNSTSDPNLARLPGARGAVASDELHPIVNDPDFRELQRRNPEAANDFYYAFTNRNYKTDNEAKIKLNVEQAANRKQIISTIRNPEYDEITGEPYHYVEHYDKDTNTTKTERVKLNDAQKRAVELEGGFGRIIGGDLPNAGGVRKAPGWTDEDHAKLIGKMQELRATDRYASLPVNELRRVAHKMLYFAENGQPVEEGADTRGGVVKALDRTALFGSSLLNTMAQRVVNPIIRGADLAVNNPLRTMGLLPQDARLPQIPLFHPPTEEELIRQHSGDPAFSAIMDEINAGFR